MTYQTKDSGKRQNFDSGMVRDTQEGKPRYDLIPTEALHRLADLYARGAEKYDDDNWKKGQPYSRAYASLFRHLIQWREGEKDEDHMAAVAWNAFALMYYEEKMPELDDLFTDKCIQETKLMWGEKTLEQAELDGDVIIHNINIEQKNGIQTIPKGTQTRKRRNR